MRQPRDRAEYFDVEAVLHERGYHVAVVKRLHPGAAFLHTDPKPR